MKGIVFTGNRNVEFRDFPDPTPGPGEVVLEIKASGMCSSDLPPPSLKLRRTGRRASCRRIGLTEHEDVPRMAELRG